MHKSAYDSVIRDIHIRMNLLRQRQPWMLRNLVHKNRIESERAQREMLGELREVLGKYEIKEPPIPEVTPSHTTSFGSG